jgi:hypothetical protein
VKSAHRASIGTVSGRVTESDWSRFLFPVGCRVDQGWVLSRGSFGVMGGENVVLFGMLPNYC